MLGSSLFISGSVQVGTGFAQVQSPIKADLILITKVGLIFDSYCHLHFHEDYVVWGAVLARPDVVHLSYLCFVVRLLCAQSVVLLGSLQSHFSFCIPRFIQRSFSCKVDTQSSFGTIPRYILHGKCGFSNLGI